MARVNTGKGKVIRAVRDEKDAMLGHSEPGGFRKKGSQRNAIVAGLKAGKGA